jgi:hypothetical protein
MENVGIFIIFYGHLEYVMIIGNVVLILYSFPRFGILCQEKSGNPVYLDSAKPKLRRKMIRTSFY